MKTRWRIFFGIITLAVVIYILRKVDFTEVYQILGSLIPKFFLLAIATQAFGILIFSLRGMVYTYDLFEPEFWFFLKTTLAGFFVNVVTPGAQIGGEPIKAYFFGKKYGKSKTKIFGAILADRIIHGAASLFFIIASLLFLLTYFPVSRELKIIFQTTLFFIMLFLALLLFLKLKKTKFNLGNFLRKIGLLKAIKNKKWIYHIGEGFGNFTKIFKKKLFDKRTLSIGILFSLGYWILNYLSSYFLFLSLQIQISFFLVIVVVSLGSLVGDLSPTPGGIGFVEGFMIFLYSAVGINISAAIIVSLLSRIIGYFFSLVLGGISLVLLEKELG